MAIVKIKDATVTRVNAKGYGVQVKEQDRGEFKGSRFTVWFKESSGLSEGDVVSVDGYLSAKVSEPWTDREGNERVSVELSVNNPKLDGFPKSEPAVQGDTWNTPSNEVPF